MGIYDDDDDEFKMIAHIRKRFAKRFSHMIYTADTSEWFMV
jgi:hypothetical protein